MQAWFRLAILLSCAALSCTQNEPAPATASPEPPPDIVVRADREDLVFSYQTKDSEAFETATQIGDIPEQGRQKVVVTDLSLSPEVRQAGRYIYLTDVRSARKDGTYPVALASRYGFEAQTSTAAGAAGAQGNQVIVYSTTWCGVCKRAKRLLKSWNVPFEEKDVEASRSAQQELAAKAAKNGFQPGGVPVIDVGGIMLQGLDERSLKNALKQKGLL